MRRYSVMLAAVACCAMLVAGCGTEQKFIKAYAGPELPPTEIAQLESSVGVILYAIDGDKSSRCARCVVTLMPGLHALEVGFSPTPNVTDLAVRMAKNRTIEIMFKKAHGYSITAWEDVKNRTYFVVVSDDTEKVIIYSDLARK